MAWALPSQASGSARHGRSWVFQTFHQLASGTHKSKPRKILDEPLLFSTSQNPLSTFPSKFSTSRRTAQGRVPSALQKVIPSSQFQLGPSSPSRTFQAQTMTNFWRRLHYPPGPGWVIPSPHPDTFFPQHLQQKGKIPHSLLSSHPTTSGQYQLGGFLLS